MIDVRNNSQFVMLASLHFIFCLVNFVSLILFFMNRVAKFCKWKNFIVHFTFTLLSLLNLHSNLRAAVHLTVTGVAKNKGFRM